MIQYREYTSKTPKEYLDRTWDCLPDVDITKLKEHGRRRVLTGECDGYLIFDGDKEIGGWLGPKLFLQP